MTQRLRLLPRLAVPVLQTGNLAESLAWYKGALGFGLAQHVPHVVALLRLGAVRLQLWQVPDAQAQDCCIEVDGLQASIFECHSRVARAARSWIGPAPALKPWGAWEFCIGDPHGHQLRFLQWVAGPLLQDTQPHPPERKTWKGE